MSYEDDVVQLAVEVQYEGKSTWVSTGSRQQSERDQFWAERARAERAEDHLRDCRRMLSQIAERLREPGAEGIAKLLGLTPASIAQMAKRRVPETCGVKMSHYSTCKLGTYGCNEQHAGEQPQIFGRVTLPAKVEE